MGVMTDNAVYQEFMRIVASKALASLQEEVRAPPPLVLEWVLRSPPALFSVETRDAIYRLCEGALQNPDVQSCTVSCDESGVLELSVHVSKPRRRGSTILA